MLAFVAAILFGLALLLDFLDASVSDAFDNTTLVTAGLFFLALHLAGVGAGVRTGGWRRARR
jgi:hypothetical protein